MTFACDIGSSFGTMVALLHAALNALTAVCALWGAVLIMPRAGVMLRLAFLAIPAGALVNVIGVLDYGCRDVSAGELMVNLGIACAMAWLVFFHRDLLRRGGLS